MSTFTITYTSTAVTKLKFITSTGNKLESGKASGELDENEQVFTYDGVKSQLIGLWASFYEKDIKSVGALSIDLEFANLNPFESTIELRHITHRSYLIYGSVVLCSIALTFGVSLTAYIIRKKAAK